MKIYLKVMALAALVALMGGCGEKEKGPAGAESLPPIKGIAAEDVRATPIPEQVEAVGTVKARNSAVIAARVAGTVKALLAHEGDRVGKGRLLLTLDAAESVAGAAGALAGVEEARRGLDEAVSRKRLADVTFERFHKLYEEQAVTKQEFDTRMTEREVASQGVARSQARLSQAREASRAAGAVAGYTQVTAPISGVITAKGVDAGMTVFPGTPLMTVEDDGSCRLEAQAPESLMGKVRPGDLAVVTVDGAGDIKGRVAEVVPTVDPMSRTFIIKVDIAAKGLRSGMFGRAAFKTGERNGIMVFKGSVLERGALTSVWVVDREKRARMRLVKVGKAFGDRVEILSGLSAGERVIVRGMEKAVDGARVE